MIVGLSSFHRLVREHPDLAFPSSAWQGRCIAPPLLLGKLFRMPGRGCVGTQPWRPLRLLARHLPGAGAQRARQARGLLPSVPVPAGGMTIDRVGEMLDFYGAEVMLLIGGALLEARDRLLEATAAFVAAVGGRRRCG